ncbi:hypothetical protein FB45DRAFT_1056124 [Roridomyces roridus]|uniref:Uncharacterized protein n=1 Tax=Roridomyces roridus TaxID=1738132 RepID=A0AAD7FQ16_9AGAR|nr:hypothetical protein FB45DRAFT_1056124 [Roridomyces roridus]
MSYWSRIPAELQHEITAYNADDMDTLRALCLASKTTRPFAITHLFSVIRFSCVEDFAWWIEMLGRTPVLTSIVKQVKILGNDVPRRLNRSRRRILPTVTKLSGNQIIPAFPHLPHVHSVEYNGPGILDIAVQSAPLFPRMHKLQLVNIAFPSFHRLTELVGSCGLLTWLAFDTVRVESLEPESPHQVPNLTGLTQLFVKNCQSQLDKWILRLIALYQPLGLRTLVLERPDKTSACIVTTAKKLLRLCTSSLVNLTLDSIFMHTGTYGALHGSFDLLLRLPVFTALDSLTIWLSYRAAHVIGQIQGPAPKLTRLSFRFPLYKPEYERNLEAFDTLLESVLPQNTSQSLKISISKKFPLCRRIAFHFCAPRDSELHYRRGMRRQMEWRLIHRLEVTAGSDIEKYLQIEWLDEDFRPIVYRDNGKPPWTATWFTHCYPEPETEASDVE